MSTTSQALRRISLFAALSDEALVRVASVIIRRVYAPGESSALRPSRLGHTQMTWMAERPRG